MTAATFDASREPMRAIRDLIVGCESGDDDPAILERAQAAFTVLRALFGDTRPAEEIADVEAMIEPVDLREPLQLCAGALQAIAAKRWPIELHEVSFTGRWKHFGKMTVATILDRANAALGTERA